MIKKVLSCGIIIMVIKMKIAVIGGGASGLFLSSYLMRKYKNINITIFDKNKSLGRKLLATGNGKCNFSNFKALPSDYNNEEFINKLFNKCSKEELINYFSSLGLMFYFDEEGRMYPISNSSQTILNLFLLDLKGANVKLETTVNNIYQKNNKVYVNDLEFDYAVMSSGSNASIDIKKCDSTYNYFKNLNLKFVKLRPSLVGFKSFDKDINILKGYRSKGVVSLIRNNKIIFNEFGEIIFKEDGISGIVIMNASHYYEDGDELRINLLPNIDLNELFYKIENRKKENTNPNYYLEPIFHNQIISYLVKKNILDTKDIIGLLSNFNPLIRSTYDIKDSQVLKGGIDVSEIDDDFRLKKYNLIFATGEVLDINGLCGGYNLMFAFMSALVCAKKIGEIYENKNNKL